MAARDRDVKLLGIPPSLFTNRVQFALNLKSVGYELIPVDLYAKSELLLKSNPVHKKIPVLFHAGKPLCESLAIVQYIDETWPDGPSILPSDPYDRAIARFWAAYIDEKWYPVFWSVIEGKQEPKGEVLGKIEESLKLLEDVLVKSGDGNEFFGGKGLGYLDIAFGCFLGWIKAVETNSSVRILDETKTPALVKWAERFRSHAAVKGTFPEPEEQLQLLKWLQANTASEASK